MINTLITDRTQQDVAEVKALAEAIKSGTATEEQVRQYLHVPQKGAYTYEDMNRVELAVMYVAERLFAFGYLSDLPTTREWSMEDKPTDSDFAVYFLNVAKIREAIPVRDTTPQTPTSILGFDIYKANALEQILVDVDQMLNEIQTTWFYSGDLYAGEV